MTDKEAIEILKIEKGVCDLDISNNKAYENTIKFSRAVETVLNLIQTQQEDIEKKDKIIDKMAYEINDYQLQDYLVCGTIQDSENCDKKCKECIKKYFEESVENE